MVITYFQLFAVYLAWLFPIVILVIILIRIERIIDRKLNGRESYINCEAGE